MGQVLVELDWMLSWIGDYSCCWQFSLVSFCLFVFVCLRKSENRMIVANLVVPFCWWD